MRAHVERDSTLVRPLTSTPSRESPAEAIPFLPTLPTPLTHDVPLTPTPTRTFLQDEEEEEASNRLSAGGASKRAGVYEAARRDGSLP